ncbi:MAG: class I SAM-dependent methyltransferase [Aeromicrobium sp.]
MSEYDAAAQAWAEGPAPVYARFAAAMLEHSPVPLAGAHVLDVGAGTAVASDAALALGARRAVASDVAVEMLRRRSPSIPAVLADAGRLPFGENTFDLVMAAFSLGHLPDPVAALTEWHRVGATAVASTFAPGPPHPAKTAVDQAMGQFGFVSPPWYERVKHDLEPQVEDPASLAALATAAGFRQVSITPMAIDAGLSTPAEIVSWRLGMAHLAQFVADLPASRRAEARQAAEDSVADLGPVTIEIHVLSAS